MIKSSVRCILVATVLQCIGCSTDTAGADATGTPEAPTAGAVAGPVATATAPDNPVFAPELRPTSAPVAAKLDSDPPAYLPAESAFIAGEGISTEGSDPILESREHFSKALAKMSDDEKKSVEAQDLARHYRNAIERAVGAQGVVEDLTCGLSLCMGSVAARSRADHDAWAERLYEDPDAVRHVTLQVFEVKGDRLQNRFLFSTDAAIKAIALPPKRNY